MNESRLRADALTLRYGPEPVVEGLSLDLPDHRITTILGPNACGKSTVLRSLARLLKPVRGAVYLDGHAIQRLPTKEVARRVGLLSQQGTVPEGITVEDLVRRGRYPHQGMFQPPTESDRAAVQRAIALAGVEELRHRAVDELSGGQRQRAWIAMALAQDTPVLLLDEPTTYLDIAHQHEVLALVQRLNREDGRTVVMVLHDINEAAAVSDRIVAMRDGRVVADGPPGEVVTPALLHQVFGVECDVVQHPAEGRPVSIPRGRETASACAADGEECAFRAAKLSLGYGRRLVVDELDLAVPAGRITAIVGPNACGKSTFLRALGRLLRPSGGSVEFEGCAAGKLRPKQFARRVAVLPQSPIPPPGILVEDLVAAGRYPHARWYRQWSRDDERAVDAALDDARIADLRLRPVDELSGGQRQRAFVAMTLARQAPVLLLDEPTTFLDIAHQVEVLDLVRAANRDRQATVVMVLHDLALASRYADFLVAMKDGRVLAAGAPRDILSPGLVRDTFGVGAAIVPDPLGGGPLVLPSYRSPVEPLSRLPGDPVAAG